MNYPDGPRPEFYGMNFEPYGTVGTLECSDDGVNWLGVCDLPRPGGGSGLAQRTVAFPARTGASAMPPKACRVWPFPPHPASDSGSRKPTIILISRMPG